MPVHQCHLHAARLKDSPKTDEHLNCTFQKLSPTSGVRTTHTTHIGVHLLLLLLLLLLTLLPLFLNLFTSDFLASCATLMQTLTLLLLSTISALFLFSHIIRYLSTSRCAHPSSIDCSNLKRWLAGFSSSLSFVQRDLIRHPAPSIYLLS